MRDESRRRAPLHSRAWKEASRSQQLQKRISRKSARFKTGSARAVRALAYPLGDGSMHLTAETRLARTSDVDGVAARFHRVNAN